MRIAALALGAVVVLALAGCTPATHGTSSPTPKPTPVFASDRAALAAAEKAYAAYLKVSDEVAADGGANPRRLAAYVTSSRLKVESKGASLLVTNGVHTSGPTKFSDSRLEQVDRTARETLVIFSTCWDVSEVHVLDSSGKDVTPPDRKERLTLEVTMTTERGRTPLVLSQDVPWSGPSLCS